MATAHLPRRSHGGALETPERAEPRVALVHVMRDALLRCSEAVALTWSDVERAADSSCSGRAHAALEQDRPGGRRRRALPSSATMARLEASRPAAAAPEASVFVLGPQQRARRLAAAARAAGLGEGFTGHTARVGMAVTWRPLAPELPELMRDGRWASSPIPARYTRRDASGRGAVARYYDETGPRDGTTGS